MRANLKTKEHKGRSPANLWTLNPSEKLIFIVMFMVTVLCGCNGRQIWFQVTKIAVFTEGQIFFSAPS